MRKLLIVVASSPSLAGRRYAYYSYTQEGSGADRRDGAGHARRHRPTRSAPPDTLQAVTTVQVGTQVSGTILSSTPTSTRWSGRARSSPGSIRRCFRPRSSRRAPT